MTFETDSQRLKFGLCPQVQYDGTNRENDDADYGVVSRVRL